MELNELKLQWNALDSRLTQVEILNKQALNELTQLRTKTAFSNLRNKLWFGVATTIFVSAVMIYFFGHDTEMQQILNPNSITLFIGWLVALCIYSVYHAMRFSQFNITVPTAQLMKLSYDYKRHIAIHRLAIYPLTFVFAATFFFFERGWIIERGRVLYAILLFLAISLLFFFCFREDFRRQKLLIEEIDKNIKELEEISE